VAHAAYKKAPKSIIALTAKLNGVLAVHAFVEPIAKLSVAPPKLLLANKLLSLERILSDLLGHKKDTIAYRLQCLFVSQS
jgi:hypothetical protein